MLQFQQWFDYLLHTGIGPFVVAHDNPAAYPYFLGAVAFALALTVINILRYHRLAPIIGQFVALPFALLALYLAWLTLAWPIGRFPFWSAPAASATWPGGLPAQATYTFLAIVLHYLLMFTAGGLLSVIWGLQTVLRILSTDKKNVDANLRQGVSMLVGVPAYLSLILLGETRGISPYVNSLLEFYVVAATGWSLEFLVNYAVSRIYPTVLTDARPRFKNFVRARQCTRLSSALTYLLFSIGLVFIVYTHPVGFQIVLVSGLYLALIWIDNVAAGARGFTRKEQGDYDFLSPRRWLLTVPLTLIVTMLGATGFIHDWTGLAAISPQLWVEAGAAAAAFMVFKPLVALARYTAGVRETSDEGDEVRAFFVDALRLNLLNNRALTRVVDRIPSPAPSAPTQGQAGAVAIAVAQESGTGDLTEQASMQQIYSVIEHGLNKEQTKERVLFEALNFRTGLIFYALLVAFYFLTQYIHITQGLNNLLITFVFGLITLIAGILNLLNNKVIKSTSPVFLLLVFVISGIAALTTLSALVPSIANLPNAMLFFSVMQDLLIFLTLGQLLYLYQLISATITVEQQETRPSDSADRFDFAYELYMADQYQAAIQAFDEVVNGDAENVEAMHLMGYSCFLSNTNRGEDAVHFITRAIEMARNVSSNYHARLWDYYDSLGRVDMALERYPGACADFEQSLAAYPKDPNGREKTKKQRLATMAKYVEALRKADREQDAERIEAEMKAST